MPIDSNAAGKYESNARANRSKYEANATTAAWQAGVDGADSPGQGLAEAGAEGLDVSRFDSAWREGVANASYSTDPDAWEAGLDGDAWLRGMRNASNWNIG